MDLEELTRWLDHHGRVHDALIAGGAILAAVLALYIARRILIRGVGAMIHRTETSWDDALVTHRVLDRLAWLAPALVIYYAVYLFANKSEPTILRLLYAYTIGIFLLVAGGVLSAVNDVYARTQVARDMPIKGYLQVVKLVIYLCGAIVVLAVIFDQSPWALLSGIGAATAIVVLVFKDTILSFVASIQLASNDMVRIGDSIEMPKYDANGEVVDIALHTIKVRNWDLTITTIPTFKLIEDSFKNWRNIEQSGARRIKRAVNIDVSSIKFLDRELREKLGKVQLLKEYLAARGEEIERYNRDQNIDTSVPINGRRMTNVGTLRAYLQSYLRSHPKIRQDMMVLVRQLEPGPTGLPLEIYVFTNETATASYESLQADIFDHLLAAIPEFDLKVFQNPSG